MDCNQILQVLDKNDRTYEDRRNSDCKNICVISKFRCSASQHLAVLATNIVKFSLGTLFGFTTILIAELYKENAEIDMTFSELTWFSSHCFMIPVGSIIIGLLAQRLGSRTVLLIAAIVYASSWLIFYYATNASMILTAQAFTGLTYPVAFGPGPTYIAEISQPHLRSTLMATNNLFILIGSFFTVLLGSLIHWRTVSLVNLSFPVIGFVAVYFIPESPQWLASKDRFVDAERAMAWLRGWATSHHIQTEFNSLKETYRTSHNESSNDFVNESVNISKKNCILKDTYKLHLQRSFYLPLALVCYMFMIHTFTGSMAILIYAIVIFGMIDSPIDKHIATVIFDALKIIGAIVCILIIHHTGKRKIMFTSFIGAASSYLTISIVVFLITQKYISSIYSWVPAIMMMIATFLTSGGIDKVVYMLNVEFFPTRFRSFGAGIGLFVSSVLNAIVNKIFLYVVDAISLPGVFLVFALVNIIAFITFYFLIPETNRKTLEEIEDYFTSIKSLKNRPVK